VRAEQRREDGSARLLVQLADGQTVESVLLPRDGLCVSTRVGCAVGCAFCMTGRAGLLRQISSAETVAQVVLAWSRRPVKKVVFMGIGEPAHNLDNVWRRSICWVWKAASATRIWSFPPSATGACSSACRSPR
jgi:23S rRNA (adenine2503-C2)-methyltransferase